MAVPKTAALPLGDTPISCDFAVKSLLITELKQNNTSCPIYWQARKQKKAKGEKKLKAEGKKYDICKLL